MPVISTQGIRFRVHHARDVFDGFAGLSQPSHDGVLENMGCYPGEIGLLGCFLEAIFDVSSPITLVFDDPVRAPNLVGGPKRRAEVGSHLDMGAGLPMLDRAEIDNIPIPQYG